MDSEEASGSTCHSGNRSLRQTPGMKSRTQILLKFHVENEVTRGLEKGVAEQEPMGGTEPIAPRWEVELRVQLWTNCSCCFLIGV